MSSIFFTLLCSGFSAFYFIANDVFKLRGDVFVFLRSIFLAVLLLPVMFFIDWDREFSFYVVITIAGLTAGVGDVLIFEANRHFSAAAISRVVVARNIILFAVWPLVFAGYWDRLISNPPIFYASVALIVISAWAMNAMRKDSISFAVIRAALPVMAMFIICDLLLALSVAGKPDMGDALVVTWLSGVTNAVVAAVAMARNGRRENKNLFVIPDWFKPAAVNGLLFFGMMMTKMFAVAHLENPGYFGAMLAIYTFWVYMLNKYWLKRAETTDPRLGFVVVLCSIGLGLLAVQIPKF